MNSTYTPRQPQFFSVFFVLILLGACTTLSTQPSQNAQTSSVISITPTIRDTISITVPGGGVSPTFSKTFELLNITPTISPNQSKIPPTSTMQQMSTANDWSSNRDQFSLVTISYHSPHRFILFNPENSFMKIYNLEEQDINPLQVQQISDSCELIALVNTTNGHKIIRVNPNDNHTNEIFQLPHDLPSIARYVPMISPTGKYISYVVFSGEQYYDTAQYQDVEVTDLTQSSQPIRLTSRGGAPKIGGIWAPDSDTLAFTDYDDQENLQVFITNMPDMIQRQLSHFQNPGTKPEFLRWSENGDRLAVVLKNNLGSDEVWVIPITDGSPAKLNLPNRIALGRPYWSEDSNRLLITAADLATGSVGFVWVDVENNKVIHTFTEKDANSIDLDADSFAFPFPMTTDLSKVGYYNSRGEWYSYDAVNRQIEHLSWLDQFQQEPEFLIMDVSIFLDDIEACK